MAETLSELGQVFRAAAYDFSDVEISFGGPSTQVTSSVAELVEAGEVVGSRLRARGLGPGEPVVVQIANSFECLVAYVGTALAGATLVPVPASYGSHELLSIVEACGARLVFSDYRRTSGRDLANRVDEDSASVPFHLVLVGAPTSERAQGWPDFVGRIADQPKTRTSIASPGVMIPTDAELMLFTSGSTGSPKGVMHTAAGIVSAVRGKTVCGPSGPGTARHLQAFPAGHMGGLLGLLRPFVVGEPMMVLPRWAPDLAIEAIRGFELNATAGPPTFLQSILDELAANNATLAELTDVEVGSASVAPYLIERADAASIRAYRSYGCTEHPCITSGAAADSLWHRAQTDGQPIGDNHLEVHDTQGRPVRNELGDLVSWGPSRSLGYLDPEQEAGVFAGRLLYTGDRGLMGDDGRLQVSGRTKEVIIRGGETMAPGEIEAMLARLPAVREAAVVGLPDDVLGESICAVVVPSGAQPVSLGSIRSQLQELGISRHKLPEHLRLVRELPKNETGKIVRRIVRDSVISEDVDA